MTTIALAIVSGVAVLFAGSLPWIAVLAPANLRFGTTVPWAILPIVMASIVAGVTEEAGFSGYMQGQIERRYGLTAAVLVNGTMFGLLHFPNHPADVLVMLPYYIAVAAVYGGLTWAANSILPALVLHSGGDIWSLGRLWTRAGPSGSSPPHRRHCCPTQALTPASLPQWLSSSH